jgi:hypothetical protein
MQAARPPAGGGPLAAHQQKSPSSKLSSPVGGSSRPHQCGFRHGWFVHIHWEPIMNTRTLGIVALSSLASFALALAFIPAAKSQIVAVPSYVPIGVSSSGSSSTVWFHEPSSRQALACQTVQQSSGVSSIQCVSAKLP